MLQMPSLDTPDTNIFWYRIIENKKDRKYQASKQYFDYVGTGKGYLLVSVEREFLEFVTRNLPEFQSFLIDLVKENNDINAELSRLKTKKELSRHEEIIINNINIISYLYKKYGNDLVPYSKLYDKVKQDFENLAYLFQARIISVKDRNNEFVKEEIKKLINFGMPDFSDAYHLYSFFEFVQNESADGSFITYNINDFQLNSDGKKVYHRISILNPEDFFSVPR
jgi:hypothetical protein